MIVHKSSAGSRKKSRSAEEEILGWYVFMVIWAKEEPMCSSEVVLNKKKGHQVPYLKSWVKEKKKIKVIRGIKKKSV